MNEIIFTFNEISIYIKCDQDEIMRDLFIRFALEAELNIESIFFKYEGKKLIENMTVREFLNSIENKEQKINILVLRKPNIKIKEKLIKLKGVKCIKCGESCQIRISDSKIYECCKGHNIRLELNELRKKIDKFGRDVNDMIRVLENVNEDVEKYYQTYNNAINDCELKYQNYDNIHIDDEGSIKYINYIMNNNHNINEQLVNIINIYNKIHSYIIVRYEAQPGKNIINLFNYNFVKNNKDYCDYIMNGKEYKLSKELKIDFSKTSKIEVKLTGVNNISDASFMFDKCEAISSFGAVKWNTANIKNMSFMFYDCSSVLNLPDMSKWNTSNVENMKYMFYNCASITSMPDISRWNTTNVKFMNNMFGKCSSLLSMPDLSKWNTSNVKDMSSMFYYCSSLMSLPDISKWNIMKVNNMANMFEGCSSIKSMPDISRYITINVTNMACLFDDCRALLSLPDISKWETTYVEFMNNMFYNCSSLIKMPDISKWNVSNARDISYMFFNCKSLSRLPDISKWNTSNVTDMKYLFAGCSSIAILPDLSKWYTPFVCSPRERRFIFFNCNNLCTFLGVNKFRRISCDMFENCSNLLLRYDQISMEKIEYN